MDDWITFSKIGFLFVKPSNIVLWFVVFGLIFLLFRYRRIAIVFLVMALGIIVFASSPITGWLYGKINQAYLPTAIQESPQAQAIVVLAGDVSPPIPPRIESQIRGNRLLHAARLYKAGKAPLVVVSGGNVFPQDNVRSEAYYMKGILVELGVPSDSILLEERSRNTHENAIETEKILKARGINKVLLATSSFHMPRAFAVFLKTGLFVIPSTTEIGAFETKPTVLKIFDKFPSLDGLGTLQRVVHEYLGIAVYCYRGWLDCGKLYRELF